MRISTIIPAFNRGNLIGATLDSILSQSRPPDEIIVVDDGSNDDTADIVSGYAPSVRLLRQANCGAGGARNYGFTESSGDVIHFMDSDDILCPGTYEKQLSLISAGADFVYGPWLKTKIDGKVIKPEPYVLQQKSLPPHESAALLTVSLGWVTVLQPCLLARSLVDRAGPYRCDLKPSEDTEFLFRLTRSARKMDHSQDSILLYRVHPEGQISEQNSERRKVDSALLWSILERHAREMSNVPLSKRCAMIGRRSEVARQVRSIDPGAAEAIDVGPSVLNDMLAQAWRFGERIAAKIRVSKTGSPYPHIFAAAPLTQYQKGEINRAGFSIDVSD